MLELTEQPEARRLTEQTKEVAQFFKELGRWRLQGHGMLYVDQHIMA